MLNDVIRIRLNQITCERDEKWIRNADQANVQTLKTGSNEYTRRVLAVSLSKISRRETDDASPERKSPSVVSGGNIARRSKPKKRGGGIAGLRFRFLFRCGSKQKRETSTLTKDKQCRGEKVPSIM